MLGLDISSTSVKLVELVDAGGVKYRVERYAIETLPRDAVSDGNIANLEGVADTVRRAWKRLGTTTRNVAMALPTSAVISKKILLPANLREQEMHSTLDFVARQTGGKSLLNGGRSEALEVAASDTRSYYWLGFTPERERNDKSHEIEVQVAREGLQVRSRDSYFDLSRNTEVAMIVESAPTPRLIRSP